MSTSSIQTNILERATTLLEERKIKPDRRTTPEIKLTACLERRSGKDRRKTS